VGDCLFTPVTYCVKNIILLRALFRRNWGKPWMRMVPSLSYGENRTMSDRVAKRLEVRSCALALVALPASTVPAALPLVIIVTVIVSHCRCHSHCHCHSLTLSLSLSLSLSLPLSLPLSLSLTVSVTVTITATVPHCHCHCEQVSWWRSQAVRYLLRFPSAYLCHLLNFARTPDIRSGGSNSCPGRERLRSHMGGEWGSCFEGAPPFRGSLWCTPGACQVVRELASQNFEDQEKLWSNFEYKFNLILTQKPQNPGY